MIERTPASVEFGRRVRGWRIGGLGSSKAEIARMTQISVSTLTYIEDGTQEVTLSQILRLSSALGVDPSKFVKGLDHTHLEPLRDNHLRVPTGTQRKVLDALAFAGDEGLIDEEIVAETGINEGSERTYRSQLVAWGWIEDSGKRLGPEHLKSSVVWILSEAGKEKYASL